MKRINPADRGTAVHAQRWTAELEPRQSCGKGCKSLLQFHPGQRFAKTAMRAAAKNHMPAWMIGAADVEAVGIDIDRRICLLYTSDAADE